MSFRKRSRPNHSSEASTTSLPATLLPSKSSSTVASQAKNAVPGIGSSSASSGASTQGMPPTKRDESDASSTTNANGAKQVRKSRSWYGSWPRVSKSSASTQVARETIIGTVRPGATADFSRFETKKAESSADSDTLSIRTLPKISETATRAKQDESNSTATKNQQEESKHDNGNAGSDPTDQNRVDEFATNGKPPAALEETQRAPASSGWLSWLSGAPAPEQPPASEERMDVDDPKGEETNQPKGPSRSLTEPAKPPPQSPKAARPTSTWFGLWSTPAVSDNAAQPVSDVPAVQKQTTSEDAQDIVMVDAPPPPPAPAANQPSAGSTWAFWSRDTGQPDSAQVSTAPEQGELAVMGDGSEASPRRSAGVDVKNGPSPPKEPPVKAGKELSAKVSLSKKNKRARPHSMDIDEQLSARPTTPQSDTSVKSVTKPTTPGSTKALPQNLLLPSFGSTYHMKDNPSIIKQITQLLLRTQQPSTNHVFLATERPKIRKAISIGVHGLFPASFLRPMIGQPTGTSIRFATHCAEAIRRWTESHGCGDCEIEKVALEGEGRISDRVDNLWKLLLNWIDHIRSADLIVVACHSQGVPVGLMLLAKLIDLGIITNARIGVCAMAGVSLGPFPDTTGLGMLMGTAAELWQFADPESEISKRYEHALEVVVNHGARVTYVGSIDDQLVPLESAVYSSASHPYIYRAVFIDGRIHTPDFIAHLVGFALKLRNLGISDHGLIRELSLPLAGSLYSGAGHSRLYDDDQIYDLAISHALETTSVSGVPCQFQKHEGFTNPNPYILPWIMRGLLEEEFVKTELYSETEELLKQFDNWSPTTKALKDVKYRLEVVRSKL